MPRLRPLRSAAPTRRGSRRPRFQTETLPNRLGSRPSVGFRQMQGRPSERPFALAPEPVCPPGSGACSTADGSARSAWPPASHNRSSPAGAARSLQDARSAAGRYIGAPERGRRCTGLLVALARAMPFSTRRSRSACFRLCVIAELYLVMRRSRSCAVFLW
jgi:hypothetical protein